MDIKVLNYIEDKFGVTRTALKEPLFAIPGSRLRQEEGMQELMAVYARWIKALEPAAAGAYAAGRLSVLCSAMQYMVSRDAVIDLSPDCWTLQLYRHDKGYYDFRYILSEIRPLEGPAAGNRETWRHERLTVFYRDQIWPILEAVNRVTGLAVGQLWGQLPLRMQHAIDRIIADVEHDSARERIADDWSYLAKGLEPAVFGCANNPFDISFRTAAYPGAPGEPDRMLKMKPVCCLCYLTEGGQYCYTCPRLKTEHREQRKEAIRAELAGQAKIADVV
jgi:hypothetical protein